MTLGGLMRRLQTAYRLGLANVMRVALYRLQLRAGLGAARINPVPVPEGPFFDALSGVAAHLPQAPPFQMQLFGWKDIPCASGAPPEWLRNPFNGVLYRRAGEPWYALPDFDPEAGDIKCIWELSRWDWLVRLAQHAAVSADGAALRQLNSWLADWLSVNPGYFGPNWKCGQEASIRILHMAAAAQILGSTGKLTPALRALLVLHLNRIAQTVSYAIAQDNNHGTSEAAALFVGGIWLESAGFSDDGAHFARLGRQLLENCAAHLIMDDGTFSQYSVNYHRMMLDTLSFAELWRRKFKASAFSERFSARAAAAARWLKAVVDPNSGDAPMLGANDGARLLQTYNGYRDHRPSAQLAAVLFLGQRAFPAGAWDDHLTWLGVPLPENLAPPTQTTLFGAGGLALLVRGNDRAFVRFPRARFRPSQADALHVDLWSGSRTLLSDAGTFSYNTTGEWSQYFSATRAHNTVEFDGRDQMPKLSRFLFGAWLEESDRRAIEQSAGGCPMWRGRYRDWKGAEHGRAVTLGDGVLIVTDRVAGFSARAILRWRLPVENSPNDWEIDDHSVSNGGLRIEIQSSAPIQRFEIAKGGQSRYYGAMTVVPVLEIEVAEQAEITSLIVWSADQCAV